MFVLFCFVLFRASERNTTAQGRETTPRRHFLTPLDLRLRFWLVGLRSLVSLRPRPRSQHHQQQHKKCFRQLRPPAPEIRRKDPRARTHGTPGRGRGGRGRREPGSVQEAAPLGPPFSLPLGRHRGPQHGTTGIHPSPTDGTRLSQVDRRHRRSRKRHRRRRRDPRGRLRRHPHRRRLCQPAGGPLFQIEPRQQEQLRRGILRIDREPHRDIFVRHAPDGSPELDRQERSPLRRHPVLLYRQRRDARRRGLRVCLYEPRDADLPVSAAGKRRRRSGGGERDGQGGTKTPVHGPSPLFEQLGHQPREIHGAIRGDDPDASVDR
mmetsp:Transcript_5512/g.11683  ORF Transcript_5512/g.11683 Transcript_5512/m.11683 type:complete len:322 (+) Transcript_5512:883-1848(+)